MLVVQHNSLIMANYDMSALEQKLFLIMVASIEPESTKIKETTFRIIDLSNLMGISPQVLYRDLKKACKSIMSKIIEIPIIEGSNQSWIIFTLIPSAIYYQGSITLKINEDAYPYLLQLRKLFTKIQLSNLLKLDSKYSIRIYQQAKSNEYLRKYVLSLEEFKDKFKLTQKSYNQFSNINLKIINPSIKEINEKTDIDLKVKFIKRGRKVTHLAFFITPKPNSKYIENRNTKSISNKYTKEKPNNFTDYAQTEYDWDKFEEAYYNGADYDMQDLIKRSPWL